MAKLRAMRKKKEGGAEPFTPAMPDPDSPKSKPAETGTGMKGKKNAWIAFVADYSHKHGEHYFDSLKNPAVKEAYEKQHGK